MSWDYDRILLSAEELGRLPIQATNSHEFYEHLAVRYDFNPTCYYPDGVILAGDEIGHTSDARYVLPQ